MSRACIPFHILFDKDLSKNELIIYGLIENMESDNLPVFFNNRTIAERLGVSHESRIVGKMLGNLKDKGYITRAEREVTFKLKNGTVKKEIRLCFNTVKNSVVSQSDDDEKKDSGMVPEIPPPMVPEIPPPMVPEIPTYRSPDLTDPLNCSVDTQPIDFSDYKSLESNPDAHKKELIENKALSDEKNQALFKRKFEGRDVSIEDLFHGCQEHYEQKNQWVGSQRFYKWINNENPENYPKIGSHEAIKKNSPKDLLSNEDKVLLDEYRHWVKTANHVPLEKWLPNEEKRNRAIALYAHEQAFVQAMKEKKQA
jgi:hypothetical protein